MKVRQVTSPNNLTSVADCPSCSTLIEVFMCYSTVSAANACCQISTNAVGVWIEAGETRENAQYYWANPDKTAYSPEGFYSNHSLNTCNPQ